MYAFTVQGIYTAVAPRCRRKVYATEAQNTWCTSDTVGVSCVQLKTTTSAASDLCPSS